MEKSLDDYIKSVQSSKETNENNKIETQGFRDSYIDFITAMFNSEISGMNAENKQREIQGDSMAYTDDDYHKVALGYRKIYEDYAKRIRKEYRRK